MVLLLGGGRTQSTCRAFCTSESVVPKLTLQGQPNSEVVQRLSLHVVQQCPKLRMHLLLLLYIGRVHGAISGCTVLWEVHPASAQNISLISDTVQMPFFKPHFQRTSHV